MSHFSHAQWIILALAFGPAELSLAEPQADWYIMAREEGCLSLSTAVSFENLSRAPISPEDFAQMLRSRGDSATVEPITVVPQWAGHARFA